MTNYNEMNDDELKRLADQYIRECEIDKLINAPAGDEIDIIALEIGKAPEKRRIPNTLAAMRNIVGGSIENFFFGYTETGARLSVVVNEEGKLIGMKPNKLFSIEDETGKLIGQELIVGNAFVTAYNMSGEETDIPADDMDKLIALFHLPIVTLKARK